jgi:hypothetical protein
MESKYTTPEGLPFELKDFIRQTVRETVVSLRHEGLLRRADDVAYSEMSVRLFEYYKNPEKEPDLASALTLIEKDAYFDIIPLFFREKYTVETISEIIGCDISTVTRNKKKLCLRLHGILES